MAGIPVVGTGPIALTKDGAHLTIPLDALRFEDGAIKADKWPLYSGAKDIVDPLLKYLVSQEVLTSATVTVAPAFTLEAAQPGTSGNNITVKIDTVTTGNPKSNTEIKAEATITKTWSGLTPDTVATRIGNSPGAGLVYVKSTGDLTKTPAPFDGSLLDAGGALIDLPVKDGPAADAATVFTLAAPADSGSPTILSVKLVADPPPPPDPDADPQADPPPPPFTLTVTWEKTATVKLSEFNAQFGHVVTCKPPNGGFVSDPVTATTPLSGGTDTPPVKATGVVASA
jgi:hypothetical protein